jgi:hypothetical protein
MAKPNVIQILFLFFLIVVFMSGLYIYSVADLTALKNREKEGMETEAEAKEGGEKKSQQDDCPDLLIQRGAKLFLYYSTKPAEEGKNPAVFNSLEEYGTYMKTSKEPCPILYLQQENNAQGNDIYRVRPNPYNPFAGVPAHSALLKKYNGSVVKYMDASRENGFNKNMYAGFDPQGLYVGRITDVDVIHRSTNRSAVISDNPMDPNWGGVLFTQKQLDSGKYEENEVTRPNYPAAKTILPVR